jgi:pyruvate, water dikinase
MIVHRHSDCGKREYMQNSTGLHGLDSVLKGIVPGDSVVWQIDSIDDYLPYVEPFGAYAKAEGKKLVYFRFAKHRELVMASAGSETYRLDPHEGFEKFITEIHAIIERTGKGGYFVFDSLSELAIDCYSERMTGNFFMLTCPLLYSLGSVSYFTVIKNYHSYHVALPITQTTQIILDVYNHRGKKYLHPLKVDKRYSATMFMLHAWEKDDFIPITDSLTISDVSTSVPWHGLPSASYRMVGLWDRRFIQAEDILESHHRGECPSEAVQKVFRRQLRNLISRDERILSMVEHYLTLKDVLHIWKRTIGSGMIGGKAVGMLLARAILKKQFARSEELMENHDSFFIGSDIYYSYIVQNGCWHIRQKQKNIATLFEDIEECRDRILKGNFPDFIVKRFSDMLEYYGQAPIIVRSSSLLEDDFGNAFSGKYESIFCVNSGSHEQRLQEFLKAIRIIYASTMSHEALAYRAQRDVLDKDEQMALLVQRVSGAKYNDLFFPQLAGVGISFNSYAWDESIDPEAGVLRIVFGLGTRAVNRHDDDYTRVVALNAHGKRPEGNSAEIIKFSQKRVDVLNARANSLDTIYYSDIVKDNPDVPAEMFSSLEGEGGIQSKVLNFENIFSKTAFIQDMREILNILKQKYGCHVDIEFTANFIPDGRYKINLLQCRPHQAKGGRVTIGAVPRLDRSDIILQAHSGIIGQSRSIVMDRIIYVVPAAYGILPDRDRYAVARLIGKLIRHDPAGGRGNTMLIGPGRWGTHMASLGVPVTFSEISTVSAICEIDVMHEGLKPDLSMGTHFFNDMVEMNILYIGIFVARKENIFNEDFLMQQPNLLSRLLPDSSSWSNAVRVIDRNDLSGRKKIRLNADAMKQSCVVYVH